MNAGRVEVVRCLDTPRVCGLTGVNPSTLDYWVRTGLLKPSHRRTPGRRRTRLWSIQDVVMIRMVSELRRAGCPLQRVRAAKRYLEQHRNGFSSSTLLVWDGSDVRHIDELGAIESLVQAPGQQVLHLLALPVGQWEREAHDRALFIRSDRLRHGVPQGSESEARSAS